MTTKLSNFAAPGESLFDYVYNDLRGQIRTHKLRPGDRLRETEISERLSCSRTPIREALKRLEADGLVRTAPPRGYIVVELTQRRVSELYALREVLVGVAARSAAEQASSMEIQSMQHIVDRMLNASDIAEAIELNRTLSETIVSAARNEFLSKALNSLDGVVELLNGSTYTAYPGRRLEAARAHENTISAIRRRDPVAAEEAARAYVRESAKVRIAMMFGNLQKEAPIVLQV